jgi:hypothetical protein
MKNVITSGESLYLQGKDKHFKAQLKKVFEAFFSEPKTMKEVDLETGIMRENICRFCRTLRLSGQLFAVCKRQCRVTKYPSVIAWTTNPELAPKNNQLKLFV